MIVDLGVAIYGDQNRLACGHCGVNIEVGEYTDELVYCRTTEVECDACGGKMRVDEASWRFTLTCYVVPNLPELAPA